MGDLEVSAHEERPDAASRPRRCGALGIVDGVRDLHGPAEHDQRR
jgi:hypothetical protein